VHPRVLSGIPDSKLDMWEQKCRKRRYLPSMKCYEEVVPGLSDLSEDGVDTCWEHIIPECGVVVHKQVRGVLENCSEAVKRSGSELKEGMRDSLEFRHGGLGCGEPRKFVRDD
jgi:hypothetical protein